MITVHDRRGTEAMNAAGVLEVFTGVAVHDAWAPYDTYKRALPPDSGHGVVDYAADCSVAVWCCS